MKNEPRRFESLDGLRGLAALSVVAYHAMLAVPAFAAFYVADETSPPSTVQWWFAEGPLRLLVPGHEAVLVFFALSGFVLTLPLLRGATTLRHWAVYYPRRLLRLYLPVWGSIAVAVALALLVPRDSSADSAWLQDHADPTVQSAVRTSYLLLGTSSVNSPLWSLTWEVWFSLLLPVLWFLIRLVRADRWWLPAMALLVAISCVSLVPGVRSALPASGLTGGLLEYLPVFGLGMLLAMRLDAIRAWGARVRSWWPYVLGAAFLLWVPGLGPRFPDLAPVWLACSLVGVVLVMAVALESPPVHALLTTRSLGWAGSRSFSIYLTHEPLIVAAALLLAVDGWLPWMLVLVPVVAVVLLVGEGFYRVVERPAHLASQATGRALSRRLGLTPPAGTAAPTAGAVLAAAPSGAAAPGREP
ncbi:acyltransferase family protein [Cellulomonas fengjieae]|uniref:acyltransferase family protein n=1 Tax=Cellulomonas fengjieae TaxID=2819978 RepID=UPI001AAFFEBD|nr:acyltransferase [Cellulomonas fengjieae]MBO3100551.1 acyltransferase [Cellulomonas fengjieae]